MGNQPSRTHTYQQYYDALQQNKLTQIPSDLDPYEILGVSKNYNWEELKEAYKRQARLVHPDKGGNEILFNIVTDAFKKLAYQYKLKQQDKQHYELKKNYMDDTPNRFDTRPTPMPSDGNFNDKFNRLFTENKFQDDEDDEQRGYGNIMEKSSKERGDIDIPKVMEKFNKTKFNDLFEKQAPVSKEVIIYKEPEPLVLSKLPYTEIGQKTEDFTIDSTRTNGLLYTDYMKAHTTSRLIDPRAIQERKEYRNVEAYEADRSRITERALTPEEIAYQAKQKQKQEQDEEIRLQRLQKRDDRLQKHYDKVSQIFLR